MRNKAVLRTMALGVLPLFASCGEPGALDDTEVIHQAIYDGQVEAGFPSVGCLRIAGSTPVNDCWCTGTLIARNLVLTAKHCTGLNEFRTGVLVSVPDQVRTVVEEIKFHPEDGNVVKSDLMVMRLSAPINNVRPVQINTGAVPSNGTNCIVVGWGKNGWNNTGTWGTKKSATMTVTSSGPYGDMRSAIIATRGPDGSSPARGTTMNGDSGSPLFCNGLISAALRGGNGAAWEREFTAIDSTLTKSAAWVTDVASDWVHEPLVAASSWGSNRLDIFVRGTDGALYTKVWDSSLPPGSDNSHWYPSQFGWWYHGGYITGTPEAVSWGYNRIDVFVRGGDPNPRNSGVESMTLWQHYWDGSNWNWQHLGGGYLIGHPSAVARPGRIDVFTVGVGGMMVHHYGDGQTFTWSGVPSEDDPPLFLGPVEAFSPAPNHVDVYAVDVDGMLWHNHVNTTSGNSWQLNWDFLGGPVRGAPTVASMASGRQDIFVKLTDKAVYTKILDNGVFIPSQTGFFFHGGSLIGSPAVSSLQANHLTLVGTSSSATALYKGFFGGSQWAPSNTTFHNMGGIQTGSPSLLTFPGVGVNMFTVARVFTPYINAYTPDGPQPFGFTPFSSIGGVISW